MFENKSLLPKYREADKENAMRTAFFSIPFDFFCSQTQIFPFNNELVYKWRLKD